MGYTRKTLDRLALTSRLTPILDEDGDLLLVNGMMGQYKLWVSKHDKSLTPCLTGEVGGMPGAWENWVTSWHTNNLEHFENYVDVGANIGYFTFLATTYGLSVTAIEANPANATLLKKSALENDADINVLEYAVTESAGTIEFNVLDEYQGSSTIRDVGSEYKHHTMTVKAERLDNLLELKGKTLVKMDIEGAEERAFAGAKEINRTLKPTYIIEYSPDSYSDKFLTELRAYGTLHVVGLDGSERPAKDDELLSLTDWLMLVLRPH